MTYIEMLKEVIANETVSEEARAIAQTHLEREDKRNEQARKRRLEKNAEDAPLIEAIKSVLSSEIKIAAVIRDEVNATLNSEYNIQKISRKLSELVADGVANVQDVKVPKRGPAKGYTLAE